MLARLATLILTDLPQVGGISSKPLWHLGNAKGRQMSPNLLLSTNLCLMQVVKWHGSEFFLSGPTTHYMKTTRVSSRLSQILFFTSEPNTSITSFFKMSHPAKYICATCLPNISWMISSPRQRRRLDMIFLIQSWCFIKLHIDLRESVKMGTTNMMPHKYKKYPSVYLTWT